MIENKAINDTVIATTAFDLSLDISRQYFTSLNNQTIKSFDIFIVNDGFKFMDIIRCEFPDLKIIEINGLGIISKNRELLINCTRGKYKYAIFSDFDDYFSINRIEISLLNLQQYDILLNDIDIYENGFVTKKSLFSSALHEGQEIFLNDILQCNYFGLSNTAVKTEIIPQVSFDPNLIAVDWYFFTLLLHLGGKAVFTNKTSTVYRQHEQNIANINSKNRTQLQKEYQIKKNHYEILSNSNDVFKILLEKLLEIEFLVNSNEKLDSFTLDFYAPSDKSWWSHIKLK